MKFNTRFSFFLLSLLVSSSLGLPSPSTRTVRNASSDEHERRTLHASSANVSLSRRADVQSHERPVWIVFDTAQSPDRGLDIPGEGPVFATHAQIVLGGTERDVPMNLQIDMPDDRLPQVGLWAVYGREKNSRRGQWPFKMQQTMEQANERWGRATILLDSKTTLTNRELLDPYGGYGLAAEVWGPGNNVLELGGYPSRPYNGPLTFVETLLEHPRFFASGWTLRDDLRRRLRLGMLYWERVQPPVSMKAYWIYLARPGFPVNVKLNVPGSSRPQNGGIVPKDFAPQPVETPPSAAAAPPARARPAQPAPAAAPASAPQSRPAPPDSPTFTEPDPSFDPGLEDDELAGQDWQDNTWENAGWDK